MQKHLLWKIGCVLGAILILASPVWGYDYYKNSYDGNPIPDVDKTPFPPPAPPPPVDKSCWLAASANVLAAAGWGLPANNVNQNASAIYGHLTTHFSKQFPGQPSLAINWWLNNYGLNPGAQNDPGGNWFRPGQTDYTDVTYFPGAVTAAGMDNILVNELNRCQYVVLDLTTVGGDHAVTLVGGDLSNKVNGQVVIHDSDRDSPGADDPYFNVFQPVSSNWQLGNYNGPGAHAGVVGFTTLCPGLTKPESAMRNYDAVWYKDQSSVDGDVFETFRVAGENAQMYGDPAWDLTKRVLHVPNQRVDDKVKVVSLLVDYLNRPFNPEGDPSQFPGIVLKYPDKDDGNILLTAELNAVETNLDGGQVLYSWVIPYQPAWEEIVFPDASFHDLNNGVKDFNVATECVPEPGTLILVALGLAGGLRRRH